MSQIKAREIHSDSDSYVSDFSEDEENKVVTWEEVSEFILPFGKYKGSSMDRMIKSGKRRHYLRYLLGWDELRTATRVQIKAAMDHYKEIKTDHYKKLKGKNTDKKKK